MKDNWLKIVGVVGIIGGAIALFLGGTGVAVVVSLVEGAFVLAGIVALIFGVAQKK